MNFQFRYNNHQAKANASGKQHFFRTWIPGLLLGAFLLSGCSGAPQSKDQVTTVRAESQTQPAKPNVSSETAPLKPKSVEPIVLAKQNQQELKPRVESDLKPLSPTKKAAKVTHAVMHSTNQTTSQAKNQTTTNQTANLPTRQTTQRPVFQRWPSEAEKKKLEAHALDIFTKKLQAICFEKANKDGLSYLADKISAYELKAPVGDAKTKPVAKTVNEQLRYDRSGIGSLTLQVSVECPEVKVRSKPARFIKIGKMEPYERHPNFVDADFPALLPWSEPADFPKTQFTVTYRQGVEIEKAYIYGGSWLESIRFLDQKEQTKLLNLDPSDLLSKTAKKQYEAFRKKLPMMFGQQGQTLVILQQELFPLVANKDFSPGLSERLYQLKIPRGDEFNTFRGKFSLLRDALRARGNKEFSGIYPVSEIPCGQLQIWMTEDELSETDQINGIELRGQIFVAVRGYERGRYFAVNKWSNWSEAKIKFADDWGDWVEPATRVGIFKVKVDDGKTEWELVKTGLLDYRKEIKSDLNHWCFTTAEKDKLLKLLDLSPRKLKEKPKWSALPF